MDFRYCRIGHLEASDNLRRLFNELNGRGEEPDIARINSLIDNGMLAFYGVYEQHADGALGDIVGMASVIPLRTAVSDKLWVEDVCVLSSCRGLGLGRGLMEFALADAQTLFGGGTFWLTSRPSRTAARSLYRSLGFVEYETGVFRKN